MFHPMNRRDMLKVAGGSVLLGACGSRDSEIEAPPEEPAGKGALIAAGANKATAVGQLVLDEGGNAVDAAVTAAFAACVTEVAACGFGGYGGHMVIARAGGQGVTAFDFNSAAPAAASENMFAPDADGNVPENHDHGWLAAGVPGTLAGLASALETRGTRSLTDALQPAIQFARSGFNITPDLEKALMGSQAIISKDTASTVLLLQGGKALRSGTLFRNPELADMLEQIAEANSTDPFYQGEIAEKIAAAFSANGGLVTLDDLAAYEAREVEPARFDWRGYTVYTAPLTAGGATTIQALNTLKAMDLEEYTEENQRQHALLEAMRIAWQDRLSLFGDPESVDVPLDRLLSDAYAQTSADRVKRAVMQGKPLPIATQSRRQGGTIHISAADVEGNMVALTLTHGASFGARVTVGELGLILGHGMSRFDPRPGQANSPGPGKRPLNNMVPTIVLKEGEPVLALGGRGGRRIPNAVYDVLTNFIVRDLSMEDSINARRMHTEGNLDLACDNNWPPEAIEHFKGLGYQVTRSQSARISAVSYDSGAQNATSLWR